jgi:hypothetical protein
MRSRLVSAAMAGVSNRFLLVKATSKATRKLHRPNSRIQDTINDVLFRFSCNNPLASAPQKINGAVYLPRAS